MGREGFEPSTLGLRVRLNDLQCRAANRNCLQIGRFQAATNCKELHRAETSPYGAFVRAPLLARATLGTACADKPLVR